MYIHVYIYIYIHIHIYIYVTHTHTHIYIYIYIYKYIIKLQWTWRAWIDIKLMNCRHVLLTIVWLNSTKPFCWFPSLSCEYEHKLKPCHLHAEINRLNITYMVVVCNSELAFYKPWDTTQEEQGERRKLWQKGQKGGTCSVRNERGREWGVVRVEWIQGRTQYRVKCKDGRRTFISLSLPVCFSPSMISRSVHFIGANSSP